MIRLVIVDDHPVFRDGLAALIDTIDGVTVVAQAETVDGAVEAAKTHKPDVVLMDLNLAGESGIAATERITDLLPDTAVLVLTMSEDDESINGALLAGARGYLLKGAHQDEIIRAIQTVASGGAMFSSPAARRLLTQLKQPVRRDHADPFPDLTSRERDVLRLLGEGLRNHVIAQRLGISQKTVANHLSNIFVKLQVEDRTQAVIKARQAELATRQDDAGGNAGPQGSLRGGRVLATVLFVDLVDSTRRAAEVGDQAWRDIIGNFRSVVREELNRFGGREIGTRGDDFLAGFESPARAVKCGLAVASRSKALGVEARAGLHIGEVELLEGDLAGIAVHIGARVAEAARPGEVWVSRTVVDLVAGSGLDFEDQGEHELKGVPGRWRLFRASV
jgi:DNA-binding NarL/FixJ family response regulator